MSEEVILKVAESKGSCDGQNYGEMSGFGVIGDRMSVEDVCGAGGSD